LTKINQKYIIKFKIKRRRPLDIKEIFVYNLTGNRQQATGNRQQATGNRQQATPLTIDSNLSKRINALRFLLIVCVVFIHNTPEEINFHGNVDILEIPLYVDIIRNLISGIIARVAVPMFFLISGFLIYSKENDFVIVLKKKCRTILLPYIIWQILYLLWAFIVQNNPIRESFAAPEDRLLNYSMLDWFEAFFGNFTNKPGLTRTPYDYPLWFLRDLFILDLFFIPLKKAVDKFPFGVFLLVMLLWVSDIQLWIVSPEALLYFVLGYYIIKYNINENKINKIKIIDIGIIYFLTVALELFLEEKFVAIHKINIVVGIIFLTTMSSYFITNEKIYNKMVWLGRHEFIIFAFHAWVLQYVIKILYIIIPMKGVLILFEYFCAVLFTVIICIISGIILNKIMPKPYKILTGGRI
jgi:surface polysaccharide O-acyltransferase-like enzyme